MFSNIPLSIRVKRKQIDALISSDPVVVILTRMAQYGSDGAGGIVKSDPTPLPPQVGKIINRSASINLPVRVSEDGEVVEPSSIMVMDHTADVAKGDTFTIRGSEYQVVFVHDDRSIRTLCELVYHG